MIDIWDETLSPLLFLARGEILFLFRNSAHLGKKKHADVRIRQKKCFANCLEVSKILCSFAQKII